MENINGKVIFFVALNKRPKEKTGPDFLAFVKKKTRKNHLLKDRKWFCSKHS